MEIEKVVDSIKYGITPDQVNKFKEYFKNFIRYGIDRKLIFSKKEIIEEYGKMSPFMKIINIISSPFVSIFMLIGMGTALQRYILTTLKYPKVIEYLVQNGISLEEIEKISKLGDELIVNELTESGFSIDEYGIISKQEKDMVK